MSVLLDFLYIVILKDKLILHIIKLTKQEKELMLWDYLMMVFFGNMFDFDGDGELDAVEMATEFMFLDEISSDDDDGSYDFCDDFDLDNDF